MISHRLTFITPLFSKGSYDDSPEIRPPSIRGQLHWWFRALGGNSGDEKAIFGGVHGGASASKIVVRINNIKGDKGEVSTLPHHQGGQASPKWAFKPGTRCDLHLGLRLGGLGAGLTIAFNRTVETWLLLGTLGLRGTRAAGSFASTPLEKGDPSPPATVAAYRSRCEELLKMAPLRLLFIETPFTNADEARRIVSDTIGGHGDFPGADSLARINHPLGKISGGRKTSPLRFRIVQIESAYHIAAVWDARENVTGNRPGDLAAVITLLRGKGKRIGHLLEEALNE
jgi:hypothetical protein